MKNKTYIKTYRNTGIFLLILSLILFVSQLYLAVALFILPNALGIFISLLQIYSLYEKIVMFSLQFLNYALVIWGIVLSIILIKTNKYNKGLLYLVYSTVIVRILNFVLYLPSKKFPVVDLIIGLSLYFFLIHHNNKFSRIINPKKQKA